MAWRKIEPRIEILDAESLSAFLAAEVAVLILTKGSCKSCVRWTNELETALSEEGRFPTVRFGKLPLEQPGLASFKKANRWIAEVDLLPYNVVYVSGERRTTFAGGGIDRLRGNLRWITGMRR